MRRVNDYPLIGMLSRELFLVRPFIRHPLEALIVIPAKAGIPLHVFGSKLDPDFRQGDDERRNRKTLRRLIASD
jgi:hypothetical protein